MAAPSVRGTVAAATNVTALNSPPATQIGDLVILFALKRTSINADITLTLNANFVEIFNSFIDNGNSDMRVAAAYKIATVAGSQSYAPYTGITGTSSGLGMIVFSAGTFDLTSLTSFNNLQSLNSDPAYAPEVTGLIGDYCIMAHAAYSFASILATMNIGMVDSNYTERWDYTGGTQVGHDQALYTRFLTDFYGSVTPGAFTDTTVDVVQTIGSTIALRGAYTGRLGGLSGSFDELTVSSTAVVPTCLLEGDNTLNELTVTSEVGIGNALQGETSFDSLTVTADGSAPISVRARANVTFAKLTAEIEVETDWLQRYLSTHDGLEVQEDGSVLKLPE